MLPPAPRCNKGAPEDLAGFSYLMVLTYVW